MGKENSNLHDGHRERLRKRYIDMGFKGFEEHQVLELILFYSVPRKNMNELAHRIINHFGSFHAVFEASVEELTRVNGVGITTAVLINTYMNVYRYVENSRRKNIKYLNHTHEIGDYIEPFYINRKNEIVTILCLDCKKKVLCFQEIFEGSFNSAQISIKKIIELVVKFNAAYVVISHNHPMGLAIPSTVDKETTRKIEDILTGMGVVLLDHLLFADGDYVSFAESGYLKSDRLNSNYFGYTSMNGDVHQETKLAAVLNDEGEDSKD